jgi:superfamily I DNA/RNA helicase
MLAAEKARRLAREGYRTLLVCFNQRLATSLIHELEDAPAPAGLDVTTFHRLCERLGAEAGVLPVRPEPDIPRDWWDETLPRALETAIVALPDRRYHAVVVDEGQDFEARWFELLQRLLVDPGDVFWVFHDPGQALIRADVVAGLGLERHELFENHRNPESIAALAGRFYRGGEEVSALRETGRRHTVITAEPGDETLEALRRTLHRLIEDERVPPWKIAVLSGVSATASEAWRRRRFGNAVFCNSALRDDGSSKGLAPEDVPEEPDEVLFETIRRFKGMEREVVVLVELPTEGDRLDELLYVGLTRATTELVMIAPPVLARRLA